MIPNLLQLPKPLWPAEEVTLWFDTVKMGGSSLQIFRDVLTMYNCPHLANKTMAVDVGTLEKWLMPKRLNTAQG